MQTFCVLKTKEKAVHFFCQNFEESLKCDQSGWCITIYSVKKLFKKTLEDQVSEPEPSIKILTGPRFIRFEKFPYSKKSNKKAAISKTIYRNY